MKKLMLALTVSLTAFGAAAQNEQSLMSVNIAGYEILLEPDGRGVKPAHTHSRHTCRRAYSGHIGTWELGFNGLRSTGGSYSMYPIVEKGFMDLDVARSFNLTANIFTFSTSFTRNNVLGMTMGVGLAFSDYVLETESAFAKADRMIHPVAAEYPLKKSKLNTLAIHIPLALEISPTRNFFFSVGGYADLVTGSHMKWKKPKVKLRGPYTEFLQAGVTARIGFHKFYVFCSYGLTEMFKREQGPALNPYTIGFGFGF